ncbi:MAG: hypothetical protein JWP69_1640 [Flaviaesturariibacter sp.]|nr:hypothetical protein [Flaviaesturariibacter sp.]
MSVEIITREDLEQFRRELLKDLQRLIVKPEPQKPWLKSIDVRRLLKISPNTLQNLRDRGLVNYTRVGGILFYKYEDIETLLERGIQQH